MKILMITTGLYPGGAEKIVLELTRNLIRKKHTVAIVSLQEPPSGKECTIVNELAKLRIPLHFLDLASNPLRLFSLVKIIRKEHPDVIHSHLMHSNLAARFAKIFVRFPLVNTIHIAERRKQLKVILSFLLDRISYRLCNAYTAVSKAAARHHESSCHLPEGTLQVIWNGSDPALPATPEKISSLRNEWGLQNAKKIIGSVGRLDWQKGYDIFLQTLPDLQTLVPRGEEWGIVFIGDGPERGKLQQLASVIAEKTPSLKIVFAGYRPDAASLPCMFDLFVMPSRYEGFGLTLTEAIAAGVPCLCSNADSLPEICAEVPENTMNADFIPGSMCDIYTKALLMKRTSGKILRTTSAMTDDYLKIYTSLLK